VPNIGTLPKPRRSKRLQAPLAPRHRGSAAFLPKIDPLSAIPHGSPLWGREVGWHGLRLPDARWTECDEVGDALD